jgi:hypothetical protein
LISVAESGLVRGDAVAARMVRSLEIYQNRDRKEGQELLMDFCKKAGSRFPSNVLEAGF